MCIICLDIEKNKLTSKDAQWALMEMATELDDEHYYEVLDKIEELETKSQFKMMLKFGTGEETIDFCISCHCDPCDCHWGTNE
jgi:hypothetical protein